MQIEIFKAVKMRMIFWIVTPCSLAGKHLQVHHNPEYHNPCPRVFLRDKKFAQNFCWKA
jgi:hypothetical protein